MASPTSSTDDEADDEDPEIHHNHMLALKRACQLSARFYADDVGFSAGPSCEGSGDDEDGDDDLFLQDLRQKFGCFQSSPQGRGEDLSHQLDEEAEDEFLLRSLQEHFGSLVPTSQSQARTSTSLSVVVPTASPVRTGEDGSGRKFSCSSLQKEAENIQEAQKSRSSLFSFLPGDWNEIGDDDGDLGLLTSRDHQVSVSSRLTGWLFGGSGEAEVSSVTIETKLIDALKKNCDCQTALRNVLMRIETKEAENKDCQRRVKTLLEYERACFRSIGRMGTFNKEISLSTKLMSSKGAARKIHDHRASGPPDNDDVAVYRELQKKLPSSFAHRQWTPEENKQLTRGLKQQVQEMHIRKAMDALSADDMEDGMARFDAHVTEIGKEDPSPEEIRASLPEISWDSVSHMYVPSRTSGDCRARWLNHEDPLINHVEWTKEEDKKLLLIAQQNSLSNWEEIALELGTCRTPAECLIRYQRSLNPDITRSNWTPEEDDQLRAAIDQLGENDWNAIASCLENRTNNQCLMRWYKVLHPEKTKKGRWQVDEDKRLKWAVSVHGPKKWIQIAAHVPGRTDLQCRERWKNVLDPSIRIASWTEEEDRKLDEAVARHGQHHWAAVANELTARTDNQCWRRWKHIHPENIAAFKKNVTIRRTALAFNFQGRRKERSALCPQDFLSDEEGKGEDGCAGSPKSCPGEDGCAGSPKSCRRARISKLKAARLRSKVGGVTGNKKPWPANKKSGVGKTAPTKLVPVRKGATFEHPLEQVQSAQNRTPTVGQSRPGRNRAHLAEFSEQAQGQATIFCNSKAGRNLADLEQSSEQVQAAATRRQSRTSKKRAELEQSSEQVAALEEGAPTKRKYRTYRKGTRAPMKDKSKIDSSKAGESQPLEQAEIMDGTPTKGKYTKRCRDPRKDKPNVKKKKAMVVWRAAGSEGPSGGRKCIVVWRGGEYEQPYGSQIVVKSIPTRPRTVRKRARWVEEAGVGQGNVAISQVDKET